MGNEKVILVKLDDQLLVPSTSGFESLNVAGGNSNAIYGIHLWDRGISSNQSKTRGTVPAKVQVMLCSTTTERRIKHRMEPFIPEDVDLFFKTLRQVVVFINFNNLEFNKYIWHNNIMPIIPYIDNGGIKRIAFVDVYHGKNLLLFSECEEFKEMEYEIFSREIIIPVPTRRAFFFLNKN